MHSMSVAIEKAYRNIQKLSANIMSPDVATILTELFEECLSFLDNFQRASLDSKIPNKSYFAFDNGVKISRAINENEYDPRVADWTELVEAISNRAFDKIDPVRANRAIYCLAICFCAVIDLTKSGDQKTPGTFFEYLIGHLYASRLGMNPKTRLPVLNLDMETTLPTDYVFDLGPNQAKFHLPIKTSTRERVIQVWAHQRVLDGVYGTGRFIGTPVILAETKTDSKKRIVIEICLPDQWRIYQMHIAQLKRIYYLDIPAAYAALNTVFPPLNIRPFGDFFLEAGELGS